MSTADMKGPKFELVGIEDLVVDGLHAMESRRLMSPFVWRDEASGQLHLLVRAWPLANEPTGRIWFGRSDDGLCFTMDKEPSILPSLAHLDTAGCEDPTVIVTDEGLVVFYTGVDDGGAAEMLWATGRDPTALDKRGVAYHCSKTEKNTKEATIHRAPDGTWRLFFEYSRDGRSWIGFTTGPSPSGPWHDHDDPFTHREGRWDGYHLSTGPLVETGDTVTMFYNGATPEARWGIGWATFARDDLSLIERCDEPLIAAPDGAPEDRDIAFAASAIDEGDVIYLYYSHDDELPRRATIRRVAE